MTRRDEIQARLDATTPGKWYHRTGSSLKSGYHVVELHDNTMICKCGDSTDEIDSANAAFIANAPADLSWCLAEIERLRGALKPFAECVDTTGGICSSCDDNEFFDALRAAKSALETP